MDGEGTSRDLVPLNDLRVAGSAESDAGQETAFKLKLVAWADQIADKVIVATDGLTDQQIQARGFNPVLDEATGGRLSDAIEKFAEEVDRKPEQIRQTCMSKLKAKLKLGISGWVDAITDKVLAAANANAALLYQDELTDQQLQTLDYVGKTFDPVVDEATGQRLSDAIKALAAHVRRGPEQIRKLCTDKLTEKHDRQDKVEPAREPVGDRYGAYLVNRFGVWAQQRASIAEIFAWKRITHTRIDPIALSHDHRNHNWRHRYRLTDETGQKGLEIANEHLAQKANRAISVLLRDGVHVVQGNEARLHLAKFLNYKPDHRVIRVPKTGWFEAKGSHWIFVLPSETLGEVSNVTRIMFDGADTHGLHVAGTSDQWRRHSRRRCYSLLASPVAESICGDTVRSAKRWCRRPEIQFSVSRLVLRTHSALPGTVRRIDWLSARHNAMIFIFRLTRSVLEIGRR
jgi:hypothetical protein